MVATGRVVTGGGEAHTHPWADITGEPSTFPPSTHGHAIADVSGLQALLDAKADDADVSALDGRVDSLEDMTPTVMVWNGSAYAESTTARVYIGPNDPGSVPDGSVWIDTTP
jgi:hypothetical protein